MARMPQADWLGEHSPKREMDRYDCVVVHTIAGFAPAHAAHFSVHQGGTIQQSRDTAYQSGANLEGNHRIIAIENEDHGSAFPAWNTRDGHAVPALTARQVEANAQILAWAHTEHGVPLQLCPDSRPGSRGLAYHRQGIDGNWSGYRYGGRVSGGENWTTSPGKVCPGDRRIDQLPAILARAKQIVGGDDDMSADEQIKSYVRPDGDESVGNALATTRRDGYRLSRTLLYDQDTLEGQKGQYAVSAGYRTIDSPASPGTEASPRPTSGSDPDRLGRSWRYAIQRIWRWSYWGYRRTVAIEQKLDEVAQQLAAVRGLLETVVDRDPSTPLTAEEVRTQVEAALLASDERIINVRIEVDDGDDEDDDGSDVTDA